MVLFGSNGGVAITVLSIWGMGYWIIGSFGRFIEFGLTFRVIDGIYAEIWIYFSGDISPSFISYDYIIFNSRLPYNDLSITLS